MTEALGQGGTSFGSMDVSINGGSGCSYAPGFLRPRGEAVSAMWRAVAQGVS